MKTCSNILKDFKELTRSQNYPASLSANIKKFPTGTHFINHHKNRYPDILPKEETRVKLQGLRNDYINANHVQGTFPCIATQGPLLDTVRDFWKMVWDQESNCIIMLTDFIEKRREKCCNYIPYTTDTFYYTRDETVNGLDIKITVTNLKQQDDISILKISYNHNGVIKNKTVVHIQYKAWGDYKAPSSCTDIYNLIQNTKCYKNPIIHCSAGVGRTGTFIACHRLLSSLDSSDSSGCIKEIVQDIRQYRDYMVQSIEQYEFIHRFYDYLHN